MDPISIAVGVASLARLAFSIVETLHSAVGEANSIDTTLQVFETEINTLANTLSLIEKGLKDLNLEHLDGNALTTRTLSSLKTVLRDCKDTLTRLETVIQIASRNGQTNFLRRSVAAIRLNMKSREIVGIRQEVGAYTSALKMTLPMLNIAFGVVQNQSIVTLQFELRSAVSSFENQMQTLRVELDSLPQTSGNENMSQANQGTTTQANTGMNVQQKIWNLNEYYRTSESVLSVSSTYLGSVDDSTAGSTAGSEITGLESTISGVALDPTRRSAINVWRNGQATNTPERFGTKMNNRRLELASKKLNQNQYLDAEKLLRNFLDHIATAEDASEHQIFTANMALASAYQGQKKYAEAIDQFAQMLESDNISDEQKSHIRQQEMFEVQMKLVLALRDGEKYKESIDLLIQMLEPDDFTERQKSCINHTIAETFLENSDATAALPWALEACEARYASQPESLYFDSCFLVAEVHKTLGDYAEAEIYLEELPSHYRYQKNFVKTPTALVRPTESFHYLAFSPDSSTLACLCQSSLLSLCNVETKEVTSVELPSANFPGQRYWRGVCFSSDGLLIASELVCDTQDKQTQFEILRWNIVTPMKGNIIHDRSKTEMKPLFTRVGKYLRGVRPLFSPDGKYAILGVNNDFRHILDARTGDMVGQFYEYFSAFNTVTLSPASHTCVSVLKSSQELALCSISPTQVLRTLRPNSSSVCGTAFSHDGHHIAASFTDGTLQCWVASTGALTKTLSLYEAAISMVFSLDKTIIIMACISAEPENKRSVKAVDLTTGRCKPIATDIQSPQRVTLAPSGKILAVTGDDGKLELLDKFT